MKQKLMLLNPYRFRKKQSKGNKSLVIFDKFLPKINHPKDTLLNDPGFKKAKDALDLEEKWLKAFFIFFGTGIFVALAFFGIIPLALGIGEEPATIYIIRCVCRIQYYLLWNYYNILNAYRFI